jgi:hypothetical protein
MVHTNLDDSMSRLSQTTTPLLLLLFMCKSEKGDHIGMNEINYFVFETYIGSRCGLSRIASSEKLFVYNKVGA